MDLFDRLGQKIGESVGIYSRTADEDETFVRQEKLADATRDATEQLLKVLTPESSTFLNSRALASLRTKQQEEKQGEKLLKIGEAMQQADPYTSLFGIALSRLGETMRQTGAEHSELDNRLMISTIDPLRGYNDGQMKEILNLKKRYDDNRLSYDAARRAHESKRTRETEEKMNRAKQKFDESRIAYYNRLIHSQDDENQHVAQLQAYAAAQAVYLRRCADLYDSLASDLASLAGKPPDRPRQPPLTLTYSEQNIHTMPSPAAITEAGQPSQSRPPSYSAPPPRTLPAPGVPSAAAPGPRPGFPAARGAMPPMRGNVQVRPTQGSRGWGGPTGGGPTVAAPVPSGAAVERCKALYNFQAEHPNELSLQEGDVVIVKNKMGDWWEGEFNGRRGLFPANHVQLL